MIEHFKLNWNTRKRLAAVFVCTIIMGGLAFWWQTSQVEAAVLTPQFTGLVGWWSFDEGFGTVAGDSSGSGNNGAVYGATWATGKYGQALSFNGISNEVVIPYSTNLDLATFSVAFWANVSDFSTPRCVIGNRDSENTFDIKFFAGGLHGDIGDGTKFLTTSADYSFTPQINTWYYVVLAVTSGGNCKIYMNGQLQNTITFTGTPKFVKSTGHVYIGQYGGGLEWFKGVIDDVRIFNRALSAAEIQDSFQKGPVFFSSKLLAQVPKGTTQFITTLSWQGSGSVNVTIQSPSKIYNEGNASVPVYQKTTYSASGGTSTMLNTKRLAITVTALSSDQNWYVLLTYNNVQDYKISVELQK